MHTYTLPTAARITAVEAENYRTKTLTLGLDLAATPGQFVMASLPRFDEKPFSLVAAAPVKLMITAVGPFTRLVHGLQVGDRIWIRGPFGRGFAVAQGQRHLALVGGGYGVAPLIWLARQQLPSVQSVHVIVGARTAADVLYQGRFAELAASWPQLTVDITTEDGSLAQRGLVTDALRARLAADAVDGIFACGPHGMLAALAKLGAQSGIPCQLSWESYMRCAIGICGACEHEGKVLCLDGPVIRSA